jgi:hypothetical protein
MIYVIPAMVLGAVWRVSDGGWHRLPYGSSAVGLVLCLAVAWLSAGWLGLLAGAAAWRGLTQGYEDWDSVKAMVKRGAWIGPVAVAAVALPPQLGCPLDPGLEWYAGAYLVIPLLANAVQPFIRQRMSNVPIEAMEGALIVGGLALL